MEYDGWDSSNKRHEKEALPGESFGQISCKRKVYNRFQVPVHVKISRHGAMFRFDMQEHLNHLYFRRIY